MKPLLVAVFLVFSGFAVTDVQAKPRIVPDKVAAVQEGGFTLEAVGPATLAGIIVEGDRALSAGDAVEIKALPKDRYGRTPVILYKPGDKRSWQEHLLQQGAALTYDRAAVPAAWVKAEADARTAKRGLWAETPLSPAQAAKHIGEFQLVEGVVTRTYKSRDTYYINFGEDWKTDFSLRIPRGAWRSFGKDFTIADGSTVRARGALFLENGPMIEVTRPQQLEILHADAQ